MGVKRWAQPSSSRKIRRWTGLRDRSVRATSDSRLPCHFRLARACIPLRVGDGCFQAQENREGIVCQGGRRKIQIVDLVTIFIQVLLEAI